MQQESRNLELFLPRQNEPHEHMKEAPALGVVVRLPTLLTQ
jgi:hypothetical protein